MRKLILTTALVAFAGTAGAQTTVRTVEEPNSATQATGILTGTGTGAVAGALVGGPLGAVVGGFIGTAVGASASVAPEVREYVVANPVEPVVVEGEITEGMVVPESVELVAIPGNDEFAYIYADGNRPVVVNTSNRQVVYSPAGVRPDVVTYVEANPVDEVTLDGELEVGASVPSSVTLQPLPDQSGYSYFYANGRPYIVADDSRQVIYYRP
ncbi:DUF1236 domain-containing protein [Aureimonas populi]|uniref:DUF1236 domain-containing protein n=1 Tax=Aureimonas populi TaxID=1701758 RepID=A0ABW5CRQ4_9HYPH|nr:DUF1236 domain-containing protein [Aureimonas populi]